MPRAEFSAAQSAADAKARCWSANSSGAQTVASSMDLSRLTVRADDDGGDVLTLSALATPAPGSRSAVADAATRPRGLSPDMMNALIRLAARTGDKLVHEAHAACASPPTTPNNARALATTDEGVELFEVLAPTPEQAVPRPSKQPRSRSPQPQHEPQTRPSPQPKSKPSFTRSLWHRLTRRRKRPLSPSPAPPPPAVPSHHHHQQLQPHHAVATKLSLPPGPTRSTDMPPLPPMGHEVPRVFGRTQVHVPLDELIDIVGHRSEHATALLHPAMAASGARHALIDRVDEHVALRSLSLRPSTGSSTAPRDFLIAEYHRAFTTPSGRRGYVVACHSVHWTQCPSPTEGAVRGSVYESGLVALEAADATRDGEDGEDRVDLFCVAEFNLKGGARAADNLAASRRRVLGSLERITRTIEERAKMLLSLDHTHVFQRARRTTTPRVPTSSSSASPSSRASSAACCSTCRARVAAPVVCRKCYARVCGACSSRWQRGRKDLRLCMECWADAALNRELSGRRSHYSSAAPSVDDSFLQRL